jgi:hypothetical protein
MAGNGGGRKLLSPQVSGRAAAARLETLQKDLPPLRAVIEQELARSQHGGGVQ